MTPVDLAYTKWRDSLNDLALAASVQARRITSRYITSDEADDVAQAATMNAITSIAKYDPARSSFANYVRLHVRQALAAHWRLKYRQPQTVSVDIPSGDGEGDDTGYDSITGDYEGQDEYRDLSTLDTFEREVATLLIEGRSLREIASLTGTSYEAIRKKIRRRMSQRSTVSAE